MSPLRGSWSCLLVLAACGGASSSQPAAPVESPETKSLDDGRARGSALVERACACDTSACVEGVIAELDAVVMTFGDAKRAMAEISSCHTSAERQAAEAANAELEELRREACACADAACAETVQAGFEQFMERHAATKGSEEQAERAGKVAEAMMECLVKAQESAP